MSKLQSENTLRFAWWAAEELGPIGSTDYVEGLSPAELDRGFDCDRGPVRVVLHRDRWNRTTTLWGGDEGEQFDPCYHLACDTYENNDDQALEINSDLIAFAMMTYAYSTETVNGAPGKKVPGPAFNLPAPAGEQGTFAGEDGGRGPGPADFDRDTREAVNRRTAGRSATRGRRPRRRRAT